MTRDARKLFRRWLKKHQASLPVRLERARAHGKNEYYRLVGVPNLVLRLRDYGTSVWLEVLARYHGHDLDILTEFDVAPEGSARLGFRCGYCTEEPSETYSSRRELLERHCFGALAEWMREQILPENHLILVEHDGGSWARIIPPDEREANRLKSDRQYVVNEIVPLFRGPARVTSGVSPSR